MLLNNRPGLPSLQFSIAFQTVDTELVDKVQRLSAVNEDLTMQCKHASRSYLAAKEKRSSENDKYQKKAEESHAVRMSYLKRSIEQLKVSNFKHQRVLQSHSINVANRNHAKVAFWGPGYFRLLCTHIKMCTWSMMIKCT